MVFLRPVVMRDADSANSLTLDRYEQIRGAAEGSAARSQPGDADQRVAGAAARAAPGQPLPTAAAPARRPAPAAQGPEHRTMATRHPLPYAFAKAHTLLLEDDGRERVLWAAETTGASRRWAR
jgi:hypothetical protein